MMKFFAAAMLGGLCGAGAVLVSQHAPLRLIPAGMTYAELAATLLAASALILAALGFFIAVLAVLGWSQFRGLVRKSATETARTHIDSRLHDGDLQTRFEAAAVGFLERQFESGTLRTLVEKRIDQVIYGFSFKRDFLEGDENQED